MKRVGYCDVRLRNGVLGLKDTGEYFICIEILEYFN